MHPQSSAVLIGVELSKRALLLCQAVGDSCSLIGLKGISRKGLKYCQPSGPRRYFSTS